jgi:hypothetical protein
MAVVALGMEEKENSEKVS